ncbi:MAG: hypothetical protein ACJ79H_03420 [Myxococcales bacterium]
MLRIVLCLSVGLAPFAARADGTGEIDWQRRVLKAGGQGAPDLNAPSIAVARLAAERAALALAQRNALETLNGAALETGGTVGQLLQTDNALRSKVQGRLRALRPVKTHYFSDGGISLQVEVPLDELPPEIARSLKAPPRAAANPDSSTSADAGAK